jgi:hypothetical protein
LARYIRIRDRIVIDQTLKEKPEAADTPSFITLVAREIEHAPSINLLIPGGVITLVANHYDGKGATIDVSGSDGVHGANGTPGLAGANTNIPGGSGAPGGNGKPGAKAGRIRLLAYELLLARLHQEQAKARTGTLDKNYVKAFCSRRRFRRADAALRTTPGEGEAADGSKLSDHRCTGGRFAPFQVLHQTLGRGRRVRS